MRKVKYVLVFLLSALFISTTIDMFNKIYIESPVPNWALSIVGMMVTGVLLCHYYRDRRIFK